MTNMSEFSDFMNCDVSHEPEPPCTFMMHDWYFAYNTELDRLYKGYDISGKIDFLIRYVTPYGDTYSDFKDLDDALYKSGEHPINAAQHVFYKYWRNNNILNSCNTHFNSIFCKGI